MPETPTNIRPCWIDRDGIVWSHHCDHKATPATAIPNEVLERVKRDGTVAVGILRNAKYWLAANVLETALTLLGDTP